MSDEVGNRIWADHEDNSLVPVLHGSTNASGPFSWTGPITGQRETRFAIVDDLSEQWTTVRRTKNELTVIRPDAITASFVLPQHVVKTFHEKRRSAASKDIIVDVGLLLDVKDRAKLDSFVSNKDSANGEERW